MSAGSTNTPLQDAARDAIMAVSIVADGSHHGASVFDISTHVQQDANAERDNKSQSLSRATAQSSLPDGRATPYGNRSCVRDAPAGAPAPIIRQIWDHLCWHLQGGLDTAPAVPEVIDLLWSWGGAFCGILLLSGLTQWLEPAYNLPLMYASFGASAVLVFGVISSPLAQPRNLVGGQVLSAIVGCCVRLALGRVLWLSAPLGMSLALVAMMLTRTTHPPGGATALIASVAQPMAAWEGFKFVVSILLGSLGMLIVALIFNNSHPKKRYPTYWY